MVGWLKKFTSLEGNPKAARNIAKNRPCSVKTIAGYECYSWVHLEGDSLMGMKMAAIDETDIFEFISCLANHELKGGQSIGGNPSFEKILKFVRMAFTEYRKIHNRWLDPFMNIDPPQVIRKGSHDALTEDEVIKLFMPGALRDTMEVAVCATMFLAGLRRSEIFALTPDCLDWRTPK